MCGWQKEKQNTDGLLMIKHLIWINNNNEKHNKFNSTLNRQHTMKFINAYFAANRLLQMKEQLKSIEWSAIVKL